METIETCLEKGEFEPLLELWRKGGEYSEMFLEYAGRAAIRRVSSCIAKGDFHGLLAIAHHADIPDLPKKQARSGLITAVQNAIKIFTARGHHEGLEQISAMAIFPEDLRREAGHAAILGYHRLGLHSRLAVISTGFAHPEEVRAKAQDLIIPVLQRLLKEKGASLEYEYLLDVLEDTHYPQEAREMILEQLTRRVEQVLHALILRKNLGGILQMTRDIRLPVDIREIAGLHLVEVLTSEGSFDRLLDIAHDGKISENIRERALEGMQETAPAYLEKQKASQNILELVRIAVHADVPLSLREKAGQFANDIFAARNDRQALHKMRMDQSKLPAIREHAGLTLITLAAAKGECEHLLSIHDNHEYSDAIRRAAWEAFATAVENFIGELSRPGALPECIALACEPRISLELRQRLASAAVEFCWENRNNRKLLEISSNQRVQASARAQAGLLAVSVLEMASDTLLLRDISLSPQHPQEVRSAAEEGLRHCADKSIDRLFLAKEAAKLQVLAQQKGIDEKKRIRAGMASIELFSQRPVSGLTALAYMAHDSEFPSDVNKAADQALQQLKAGSDVEKDLAHKSSGAGKPAKILQIKVRPPKDKKSG